MPHDSRRPQNVFAALRFVSLALGLVLARTWAAPVAPRADAVVALDGSGQYTSINEAIGSAPMNTDPNAPAWTILVKPGTYKERVYVQRERGHMRVIGEDAEKTVIAYNLSARVPGPDGKPIGTFRTPTVQVDGDGMEWENITFANTAGPVHNAESSGGQALALRADGDRLVFRHCRFLGWQDTILVNRGRQYFIDCYIEGHVDFIFGGATVFFDHCHIHCLGDGYITAASTPKGQPHGYVFADCTITGEPGVKTYLGRPWREFARTVFIRTTMSNVVRPEGWHDWNKPKVHESAYYGEYASTGPGGSPAGRVSWAKQLNADDAGPLTPSGVLAGNDGWNPTGKVRIVLVGDSTVADRTGWGIGFKQFLSSDVECINLAAGGRSSKSYRSEGRWDHALALKGDYYLIQFGHNDQPGKGPDRETDARTTFAENIARYVDEVRALKAQPILVTSLTRRNFDKAGKIVNDLADYVAAVRKVAATKHVPLIDLNARSIALCESWGPDKTGAINPTQANGQPDRTHLDARTQAVFAQLVVEDLRVAEPALDPVLSHEVGAEK